MRSKKPKKPLFYNNFITLPLLESIVGKGSEKVPDVRQKKSTMLYMCV